MKEKIVIACDSFKGCLRSEDVASAVAEGIRKVMPLAEVKTIEVADGGEGTSEILTKISEGENAEAIVSDPLGRKVNVSYGIVEPDKLKQAFPAHMQKTAIIEMAQASGLTLLTKDERNPMLTSTFGTGEMILDALSRGCRRFLIGIGGSATNDGGTGMLESLGFRFIDRKGKEIKGCCGATMTDIAEIDGRYVPQEIFGSEFIIACDVNTPFCGEEGAARVFARQKGADEKTIELLEEGMQSLRRTIISKCGIDLNKVPGSGAAGGLGGAFKAFLNAELKSGIDMMLDAAGFDEAIEEASLVITGEGRIDFQSGKGKVIDGICRRCKSKGIPVMAIAGIVDAESPDEVKSGNIHNDFITVLPIGAEPQNESDLEYAMRPEVARKNISDTVAGNLMKILSKNLNQR